MYIEVSPSGGKLWRFRYRIGTVEKKLSIGSYPEINLKDARQAAYEACVKVASGGDRSVIAWLQTENMDLGGRPIDLIRTNRGLRRMLSYAETRLASP